MTEKKRINLRETRRLMMADLETSMLKGKSPEDSIFYYHSSEDRIVLSHALFWVMTKSLKGKVAKEKNFDKVKCRKIEQMLPQLNKIGFVSPERRYEAPVCCTTVENVI